MKGGEKEKGLAKKALGLLGESLAEEYLKAVEGYRIIEKNFSCPLGEIDLIAKEGNTLVFVEVRSSGVSTSLLAEESIGYRKQKKIKDIAYYYLKVKGLLDKPCRFDVLILKIDKKNQAAKEVKLFKNAFF